jgi:BirA family biotin operon repressor/biotin-[acetyl-CoA-carboxylase] ligase
MWDIRRVEKTGSTNADLAAAARAGAAEGLVIVADHQAAGRGRLGRVWETPPGQALTVSFLLRPSVPVGRWPWLPLVTGIAVVDALESVGVTGAGLKWPNDVLVGERKLAGILAERVETPPLPAAVVIGVGLNVAQEAWMLPDSAVSLATLGVAASRDEVLDALAAALAARYAAWVARVGDPDAGVGAAYRRRCRTLGRTVRVELPGGDRVEGTAVDIDESGCLVVDTGPARIAVSAGDVVHVRPA